MIKFKETYTSYTTLIDTGRLTFFIVSDNNGSYIDNEKLISQAKYFPRVVFTGEALLQREELSNFINRFRKINKNSIIEINTKGTIKPSNIKSIDNIVFNVNLEMKKSKIEYDKRIVLPAINWFKNVEANFIFDVDNENELDECSLLVAECELEKRKVFIKIKITDEDKVEELMELSMAKGYNIAPDFSEVKIWPEW